MSIITNLFAITAGSNPTNWLYAPDGYQEEPVPIIGYSMAGRPIRQGYPEFTFLWSFMDQDAMTALMTAYYSLATPERTVHFINKDTGLIDTLIGMMHEPIVGTRSIIYYQNVAVKFGRCIL